jgi:uncharacterized protein involved in cysteine biosynthesis
MDSVRAGSVPDPGALSLALIVIVTLPILALAGHVLLARLFAHVLQGLVCGPFYDLLAASLEQPETDE